MVKTVLLGTVSIRERVDPSIVLPYQRSNKILNDASAVRFYKILAIFFDPPVMHEITPASHFIHE